MAPPSPELPTIVRRFIEDAGSTTQSLGVGRVVGQIYAYLYFSREPRNLADLQAALGISKGSASTVVRQLEQWNAVRKVWVKGDRRDYYEANDWLGQIVRNVLHDTVGKKLVTSTSLLNELNAEFSSTSDFASADDEHFVEERLQHLRKFHEKAQKVWTSPIVRMLLK
ncbi:MAG: hypothetical protein O3A51_08600 [Verrucomicrobia bacterium]|nr:hypothetical protein [Verrucomicrobiota bacterium]